MPLTERGKKSATLLVIDDEEQHLKMMASVLEKDGLEILTTTDPHRGMEMVQSQRPHIVLVDLMMPGMTGMEVLERIMEVAPGTEVVLMTAHYSTESAVAAIQKGASDYLQKPIPIDKLQQLVTRLLDEVRRDERKLELERELLNNLQFQGMVGQSPAILEVFGRIRRVAPHFRTVLVSGATGTGKELVAKALHDLSPAAGGPFAVCNCSAVVETLFESELFGHVKGAFTGAIQDKVGLFEYARNGTVFLDEIGDMPLATQAKLLRVLQSQEVQRVGSPVPRKVNARVIAATNRDLRAMVAEKTFREDLFYRLSMVEIRLPRLSERKEDLPLLERYFLERFAAEYSKPLRGLTPRAAALLARYSWPGNVRELENALGNACMMAEGEKIDVRDLPASLRSPAPGSAAADDELVSLDEVQRRHILRVLERVGGNKTHAISILGIGRTTLYRILNGMSEEQKEVDAHD